MSIFPKILSFIFYGQIWSQNPKFQMAISCRGTVLYAYYDLNVYFFKSFIIHTESSIVYIINIYYNWKL